MPTSLGPLHVVVVGDVKMPAVFTYHEAGLTPAQTFGPFFQSARASELSELFCWYHVHAPGTEDGAPAWTQYVALRRRRRR